MPRPDILMVVDDPFMEVGLTHSLEHYFACSVHCTGDFGEAAERLRAGVGLLIVEPYAWGYHRQREAAAFMSDAKSRNIPVIALTSQYRHWLDNVPILCGQHYDQHMQKPAIIRREIFPAIEELSAYRRAHRPA